MPFYVYIKVYEMIKKFNIKTTSRSKVSDYRHCPRCETEKLKTEFYNRRNGKGNSVYCRSCTHDQTINRQRDFKQKCIDYKGGKCVCCGHPLSDNYHLDHIVPIALGGANEDWNIQLLRGECNLQKHAKHPVNFMQSKGFLL